MIPLNMLYFGVVEDVMDPLEQGRLRVRVYGIHSRVKSQIPTDKLPWARVTMPVTDPFISGIGWSPTGMVPGQTVALIPLDQDLLQEWMVLFSVGGRQVKETNSNFGFSDPEGLYPLDITNHDVNMVVRGVVDSNGNPMGAISDKAPNRETVQVEPVYDKGDGKGPVDKNPEDREERDAATQATDTSSAPWMKFAESQLGVNEKDNDSRIREYHTQGGGSSRWGGSTPWCASFVGWCLVQAKLKGSGSALARSYTSYGNSVKAGEYPYGSIIVVAGSRGPSSGHVCFATGTNGDRVTVIGGNQSDKSYDSGGAVTKSSFPKSKILAVRWPVTTK